MNEQQPATNPHASTINRAPSVDLHIDQLLLQGFAQGTAGDRALIGVAVEQELGRLLAEQGVPAGLSQAGAVARLDGGTFEVAPDSPPEAIGMQVAQAIYRGLGR